MKHGYRGYIFSRKMGENFVPQRIQNLVIRDYAKLKRFDFLLSSAEYYMEDSYMMLQAVLKEEIGKLEGVIFYSINQLPSSAVHRLQIYHEVMNGQIELHFALEQLAIRRPEDVLVVEDIFNIRPLVLQSEERLACEIS